MAKGFRRLFQAIDYGEVVREYPPPPEYFELDFFLDPDQIERRQFQRLREEVWRAYDVAFYRRRWDAVGFHPSQLRTMSDLREIPIYNIGHIRDSLAAHPPYGDYQGVAIKDALMSPSGSIGAAARRAGPARRYTPNGTARSPPSQSPGPCTCTASGRATSS